MAPNGHLVGDRQSHAEEFLRDGRDVAVRLADGRHEEVLLTGDQFVK